MNPKGPKASRAQEATCPECGEICSRKDLIKEWEATPKELRRYHGAIRVFIHYWQCPACGHKFRTATRIWPKKPKSELEKIEAEAAKKQAKTMGKVKLEKIRKKLLQRQTQGTVR